MENEKVIKELEECIEHIRINEFEKIPCWGNCQIAMMDALGLLKEQEPKQIVRKQGKRENSDGSIDYFGEWYCPHCGKLLNRGFDLPWIEFCYKCGKPILWECR